MSLPDAVSELLSASRVQPGWRACLEAGLTAPAGRRLTAFLARRLRDGAQVCPSRPWRALELTAPERTRVIILGQDPYASPGLATGLAFAAAGKVPPSLRNIRRELSREYGRPPAPGFGPEDWAGQGVLLLNSVLTTEEGHPLAHAGRGWEELTEALLRLALSGGRPIALLLWGRHAEERAAALGVTDGPATLVLRASHPSPLSATRGPSPFIGCDHFRRADRWLAERGRRPVDWLGPDGGDLPSSWPAAADSN